MAISYIQAFNAGELSRKIDGRSDLEMYKTGCRNLDNFYVLFGGGVERRSGTKFIAKTKGVSSAGDKPAKIIPFDFSADTNYIIEVGVGYIRVYNSDGSQVSDGSVSGTVPYAESDLDDIQFIRRYDTLILTHPNHEPLKVVRATIAPTFTVSDIDYVYPPLLDKNITATTITPSHTSGDNRTLTASSAIFRSGHIKSVWAVDQIRTSGQRTVTHSSSATSVTNSDELDVSFSNFSVTTSGEWKGSVVIQRNKDGAGFVDFVVLGNTSGGTSANFSFSSSVAEDGNTKIRVQHDLDSASGGTIEATLTTDSLFQKGLVEIDGVAGAGKTISAQGTRSSGVLRVNCTGHGMAAGTKVLLSGVTSSDSTVQSALEGDLTINASNLNTNDFQLDLTGTASVTFASNATVEAVSIATCDITSDLSATTATTHWSEAAFSDYRKFPVAGEFFQNRLFFTGSEAEPSTVFGSVSGDIYNFLTGTTSDMAIKRTVDTPENAQYLIAKNDLFMGTDGGTVSINSVDADSLITASNINTQVQNSYGAASIQAVVANDVVVYVQRNGLKLRELTYSREANVFVGNDLNILSEDITGTGIKEMFVQKNPEQIIWCIKEDGSACILTYDRLQKLTGWANINTTGTIVSGATLPSTGEDSVFLCVNRGTSDSPIYCIEQFQARSGLDWYVDSGVTATGSNITSVSGLDHLEGKTVQVISDGNFHSTQTVSSGSISIDRKSSTIIAGLSYISTLRPMPIEPNLVARQSQSRVKAASKIIVRFLNTKGASVGEQGRQLTNFPVLQTTDPAGQAITLKTGQQRFFVGSDYEREKLIEVRQDLPYPMTVLSIATNLDVEGS